MGTALLAMLVGGGLTWVFWHFSEDRQIRRQLRDARTKRIAELEDDELAKMVGRVRAGQLLTAPLTGRRCVYFVVLVEERQLRGMAPDWKTVIREARSVPFMLDDGSGRALVDATAARIAIDFDRRSHSGTFENPTNAQKAFLERHGEHSKFWTYNRSLRYREAVIAEGETIAVLGAGTREPDPEAPPAEAYRGEAPTRLRLTSSPKYPLVISDDPSVAT